ncbi:MAG: sn-glycerol-3-phosphate ABC transporter ATP-binding protein UgpC [Pseudomonadota bacterium]
MAEVVLKQITKAFGDVQVIKGVDLTIQDREFCVFVGPSGCGKSTLLRLIAGLEDITSGEMSIDNIMVNDLPPAQRGIAMVFQSYALYPHMTVEENMAFGLKLSGASRPEINQKVGDAAKILQLDQLLRRRPRELSGGQRQRVAIGRAIVREPKVFLFDEPLSNLDAALRVQMRIEIARLHGELDATMVYVTHDQVEAMTLADKIVVLQGGIVEQVGSPLELYHHPDNLFVAGFIGSPKMNFIKTKVNEVADGNATVDLPGGGSITVPIRGGAAVGQQVTLGVRPEHLAPPDESNGSIKARVFVVERLGGETYAYVKMPNDEFMTVHTDGESPVREGEEVDIGLISGTCHLFDENGLAMERPERHPLADMKFERTVGARSEATIGA